jgi:hypothetical protein
MPNKLRATLKTTGHLTKQIMFVKGHIFTRMSVPMHSTDAENQSTIIGVYGNDLDILAPAAIDGTRLGKCVLVLVPELAAIKLKLLTFAADPVHFEPPDTLEEQVGSQHLKFVFDKAEQDTPVIALLPVVFAMPIRKTTGTKGFQLNADLTQVVTAKMCPCKAARVWMTALNHLQLTTTGVPSTLTARISRRTILISPCLLVAS